MKLFVINLDKDKDRMAFVDAQLRRLGVDYERVSGVYGKALSQSELHKVYNSFRWWCSMGWSASMAEVGCALSHYNIYRQMVDDESLTYCCILEDDVELSPQFTFMLNEVEKWLDASKPQVIILNDHEGVRRDLPRGIYPSFRGLCTDGYVLTRVAARKLIAANFPIIVPCDRWCRWVKQKYIQLYHAVPAVVRQKQDVFGSTTIDKRISVSSLSPTRRILYKVKRAIGKTLDLCFIKMTGR